MTNALDVLRGRHAVRKFKMDPVSEPQLRQLIDAATLAPSAMNEQPWLFAVVSDTELLNDISRRAKAWLLEGGSAIAQNEHLRRELADPDFQIFHHAPVLIVVATRSTSRWAGLDCALAAQNLMLAASGAGLGSCWIGMAEDWLNTPAGRAAIGLPQDAVVIAPVALGVPAEHPIPVPRRAPLIVWTGDGGNRLLEDGDGGAQPVVGHGLYGGLIPA